MRQKLSIIILVASSTFCFSQEIQTLFSNDSSKAISLNSYGGPVMEASNINNDWGIVVGGKGGLIINRKFAFGGIGKRLVSNNYFSGSNQNGYENSSLTLDYRAGGIFIEYFHQLERPIHISIPVNFLAAGVSIYDAQSEAEIESAAMFIIEPGISLEFNATKFFMPSINLSYRQVFGNSLTNLSNQNLSGLNIGLIFKFGQF